MFLRSTFATFYVTVFVPADEYVSEPDVPRSRGSTRSFCDVHEPTRTGVHRPSGIAVVGVHNAVVVDFRSGFTASASLIAVHADGSNGPGPVKPHDDDSAISSYCNNAAGSRSCE